MIAVLTEEEDAPGGSSHDPTRMGGASYPERNTNRSQPPSRFGSVGCQCLRCVCYCRTSVGVYVLYGVRIPTNDESLSEFGGRRSNSQQVSLRLLTRSLLFKHPRQLTNRLKYTGLYWAVQVQNEQA
jgi:hypothetical protein